MIRKKSVFFFFFCCSSSSQKKKREQGKKKEAFQEALASFPVVYTCFTKALYTNETTVHTHT